MLDKKQIQVSYPRISGSGRFRSPAFLEGYYNLPAGSLSGKEGLDVSRGIMSQDVYMVYLGMALKLAGYDVTKEAVSAYNVTKEAVSENDVTKEAVSAYNVTKEAVSENDVTKEAVSENCPVCGVSVRYSGYGRRKVFCSDACRVKNHRNKWGV